MRAFCARGDRVAFLYEKEDEKAQAVAAETGTRYSDTCSVLKDSEGWLRDDLQNGDYIHLNAQGFTEVLNYLRTHAYL